MLGIPDDERPQGVVKPTRKIASKLGTEEFVRVKIGQVGERLHAGDVVEVRKSAAALQLITSPFRNYFEVLREKFRWGER